MSFMLAEKLLGAGQMGGCAVGDGMADCPVLDGVDAALAGGEILDGSDESAEPELSLAPLLLGLLLATLAVWVAAGAAQWLLSRLLPSKRLRRLGHWPHQQHAARSGDAGDGDSVEDDSSAAPFDSPPTPPPTSWLRDADGAGAAVGAGYFNSAGWGGGRSLPGGAGTAGAGLTSPHGRSPNGFYTPSHYSTPGGPAEPLLFSVGTGSYGGGTPYTGGGGGYTTGGGTAAGTGGGRAYGVTPGTGGGGLRLRSAAQRQDRRAAAEAAASASADAAAGGAQHGWRRGGLAGWFGRLWRRRGRGAAANDDAHGGEYADACDAGPSTSYGAAAAPGGWDPALLARQAALLPAISSVEGLVASKEFQDHMRSTRRRSPALEGQQAAARLGLYRHLRRMDPEAFRRLLSRSDVRAFDSRPAPLPLLLVEYLVSGLVVPAALAALAAGAFGPLPAAVRYGAVAGWLALRLWLAGGGHVSPLGRLAGAYLVYDDVGPEHVALYGNGWACLAGLGAHLALAVVEVCLAAGSLGLLVPVSVLSLVLGGGVRRRWGSGGEAEEAAPRQTLAMRLLRVRMEVEVTRPISLSPYSPSADPTATNGASPLSTPLPFGFGLGGGGGSDGGGSYDSFGFGSAQGSPRAPPGSVPAQTRYGRLAPPHWFR